MEEITVYYNYSCSKCAYALEFLQQNGITPQLINYLAEIPTFDELKSLLNKLGLPPQAIVRTNEPFFIENYSGKNFTNDEWFQLVVDHPFLLQRPILVKGEQALIARDQVSLDQLKNW